MTVRVGVIGTGIMGSDHARTLHRSVSGAAVVRLADVDLPRARAVADEIAGSEAGHDPLALISDPAVDAVIIASHDSTHAALALAAVRAGKPVLCEKPLAPTLSEGIELLAAAGSAQSLISVGFMRRFDPGYADLRLAIAQRSFGAPLLLHSVGRGVSSGPGATSESSVTNSAIHDLDIVPWLLNSPVVEVSWHAPKQTSGIGGLQDPQLILLRTADGVLSTVETFLNARYGYDIRCEVIGELGTASLAEPVRLITDKALHRSTGYAADWRPRFAEAYRLELQAWADRIAGTKSSESESSGSESSGSESSGSESAGAESNGAKSPLATAQDGLIASAVADAVIASMHSGGLTTAVQVPAISVPG